MTINQKQDSLIEDFAIYDDWMEKYEYIISLAKDLPALKETEKQDHLLIKGCQSQVWLLAEIKDDLITFRAESDAIITKGLVALVISVLSGHTAKEILDADLYFVDKIGLTGHLSPTRANGFLAMLKQMKLYALAFSNT